MNEQSAPETGSVPAPPASPSPLRMSLNNTRQIVPAIGLLGFAVIGVVIFFSGGHTPVQPPSKTSPHPALDTPAGGSNRTSVLETATNQYEDNTAERARKNGGSFTAQMRGNDLPSGHAPMEMGDTPVGQKPAPKITLNQVAPAPAPVATSGVPATNRSPSENVPRADVVPTPRPTRTLSNAAKNELLAAWAGQGAQLDMVLSDEHSDSGTATPGSNVGGASRQETPMTARVSTSDKNEEDKTHTKRTLLLAAGRGVYGHSVLTSNSDLGAQVLVQIDSGPLAGDRVSGTLQMKNDRLLIKFSKLMMGDADPISVSGYAVSPDTAETGLASEVKQHLVLRTLLPAAAGFVTGLGNAAQNSNTTSVTSGLGVSSFTHLTLPEQLMVGAGQGAQAFAQALNKMTPTQDTVILDKDDPVGIIFDEPVYAP